MKNLIALGMTGVKESKKKKKKKNDIQFLKLISCFSILA